jgi:hypothetical protein
MDFVNVSALVVIKDTKPLSVNPYKTFLAYPFPTSLNLGSAASSLSAIISTASSKEPLDKSA